MRVERPFSSGSLSVIGVSQKGRPCMRTSFQQYRLGSLAGGSPVEEGWKERVTWSFQLRVRRPR